uniref:B1234D02.15 protein n=1 Tax=Oryza sativa subsp. japonica TaxID=39947 RepID=Q7XWM0_ORYSJ|nr:OSJNBb0052B05.9 [Oryza sativa Japonica Group]CAE75891.1 B1234D02.15 [Oryza sativa Japonica Group]
MTSPLTSSWPSAIPTFPESPFSLEKNLKSSKASKATPGLEWYIPGLEIELCSRDGCSEWLGLCNRKKKFAVKKKSAATESKPAPLPPPPPSSSVHHMSSERTPSAVGSHNIEEAEQPAAPAIPALADLFSFDIKDYFDETEEDTTSKALAPLSDDVKKTLEDISHRLEASSLDSLVKAKQRLVERQERKEIEATIQANRQLVHEEKSKLDKLSEGTIKSNIDQLEARKIELLAQLQECNAELDLEHKKLADLPQAVEEQKAMLKSAIKNVADMTKSLKIISGTDAQDAQAIEEIEQIRQRAISAIQHYLSQ